MKRHEAPRVQARPTAAQPPPPPRGARSAAHRQVIEVDEVLKALEHLRARAHRDIGRRGGIRPADQRVVLALRRLELRDELLPQPVREGVDL